MKLDTALLAALDNYIHARLPSVVPHEERKEPTVLFSLALPDEAGDYIRRNKNHDTFSVLLDKLRAERNLLPAELYRKACIDRRLYSRIMSERHYQPSKNTAAAFGLALELNAQNMDALLESAGYTLNKSAEADLVLCFCIEKNIYDISAVNQLLKARKQAPL